MLKTVLDWNYAFIPAYIPENNNMIRTIQLAGSFYYPVF